jgi:hypothetical protein
MTTDPFASDDPFASPEAAPSPASAPPAGGLGQRLDGIEARREQRVRVSWPARVQLPDGRVIELRVKDISDGGVGFTAPLPLPQQAGILFAIGAPSLEDPKRIEALTGTIKIVYVVLQQGDYQVGALWQDVADETREMVGKWVRRHRR